MLLRSHSQPKKEGNESLTVGKIIICKESERNEGGGEAGGWEPIYFFAVG